MTLAIAQMIHLLFQTSFAVATIFEKKMSIIEILWNNSSTLQPITKLQQEQQFDYLSSSKAVVPETLFPTLLTVEELNKNKYISQNYFASRSILRR